VNRWDRFTFRNAGPKKPPPEHGIKMNKAGTTWWGQRWIDALETVLGGHGGRLSRGRSYARAGRTHDLSVKNGKVGAKVTGSRDAPYDVEIRLSQLSDLQWDSAIAQMAAKAQFAAELLAGEMPREIDAAFRAAGSSLFPQQRAELVTECSCPDWGDPCKHVAATHYVLGEALDRDPFLLFELRGRTKEQVVSALRAARGGDEGPSSTAPGGARARPAAHDSDVAPPEVPRVTLGKMDAADYERPRAALPSLHLSFDAPTAHGAVLRQLGVPAAWSAKASPADALSPLVQRAAEAARRIAMTEPEPPPTAEPTSARRPATKPVTKRPAPGKKKKATPRRTGRKLPR
jgi:uncharacterized Zn finger protein